MWWMRALFKNTRKAVFFSTIDCRSVPRISAIGPGNLYVFFLEDLNHFVPKVILLHSLMLSPSGGPALPEGSNRDCYTGRHLEGDAKVVLRHHLQAGGQHKRRRLDDLSPWQEPQGKQSKEPFYLGSRNLRAMSEPEEPLIITMRTGRCFTAGNQSWTFTGFIQTWAMTFK